MGIDIKINYYILCLLIFIQMAFLGVMHCVSGRTRRFAPGRVLGAKRPEPVSVSAIR